MKTHARSAAATRIKRLTPEQLALFPVVRDEWLRIGLSTEPGDRGRAQAAIGDAYRVAGLEPPRIWVWLDSPLHGAHGAAILAALPLSQFVSAQVRDQVRDQVSAQVYAQVSAQVYDQVSTQVSAQVYDQVSTQVSDQVYDQVRDQVSAQVYAQVSDQVSAQVYDQVSTQVSDQVYAQVSDQVSAQVYAQVYAQVSAQVRDQVSAQVYAQAHWYGTMGLHDAGFLSFYAFFLQVCRLQAAERMAPLMRLALECGWWWPFRGLCIVTPKPSALSRDARGRLHDDKGPALDYAGAWGIWAWHGVRVPRDVIEHPERITSDSILQERNAEVRRVMLERMGMERFVCQSRAAVVHTDTDGTGGPRRLLSIPSDYAEGGRVVVLHVSDPAKRRRGEKADVFLRVPPDMTRCDQATAWTFGIKVEDYRPEIEV